MIFTPALHSMLRCLLVAALVATSAALNIQLGSESMGRRGVAMALGLAVAMPNSASAILPICEDGIKKPGCRAPYKFT